MEVDRCEHVKCQQGSTHSRDGDAYPYTKSKHLTLTAHRNKESPCCQLSGELDRAVSPVDVRAIHMVALTVTMHNTRRLGKSLHPEHSPEVNRRVRVLPV